MPPLVIGIGNPIRGDDALGWAAIEALKARGLPPGTETLCVQQLSMDLVESVAAAEPVFFVDARLGQPAGRLHAGRIAADTCLETASSHFFDPRTLLAAVQALYGHHPQAGLFSISTTHFEYGAPLSPEVQRALPQLVSLLLEWLREGAPRSA